MKILVCGSRHWDDKDVIADVLTDYVNEQVTIIHGDARGADKLAAEVARFYAFDVWPIPADWKKHGNAAGPLRNRRMLDMEPDLVIAFGDGRGTGDTVREAERRGIPVRRIYRAEIAATSRTEQQPEKQA